MFYAQFGFMLNYCNTKGVFQMKKRIAILLSLMLLAGCTKQTVQTSNTSNTSNASTSENSGGCAAFAECESSEDEAKLYEDLLAAKNTPFEKATMEDVVSYIENKESNIVFLGFRDCPWCQDLMPILNDIAIQKNVKIKYVNVRPENTKESDLRNENNPTYVKLQELLGDVSGDGTNKIYVPYVAVIRDGKVIDFMLSLDYDAHTVQITEAQIEEYKTRLNELLDK